LIVQFFSLFLFPSDNQFFVKFAKLVATLQTTVLTSTDGHKTA